jgi:hypothetical protein
MYAWNQLNSNSSLLLFASLLVFDGFRVINPWTTYGMIFLINMERGFFNFEMSLAQQYYTEHLTFIISKTPCSIHV